MIPTRPRHVALPPSGPLVRRLGGPILIVVAVLIVLNGFAFRGRIVGVDIQRFWLPTYCHLGRSLAAGHIPAWNPYVMGGAPFAADPQSGWMYLPVMALFTALPCDVAIRAMVVLQPILAGLGIYWFARSEGLSRPAATTGGLVLALTMASGELATSLPFAGSLAWTALLLAAASRYLRASSWPSRLLWCTLGALAWGQLAAAHFSVGLVFGSGALLAYLGVAGWRGWEESRWLGTGSTVLLAALLVVLAGALNLAYLVPRLAYLPRTDLSLTYGRLAVLEGRLAGMSVTPAVGPSTGLAWPLKLATFPGVYVGAVALLLSFAGAWSKRGRKLFIGLAGYGLVGYLLSLSAVAHRVPRSIWNWRPVDMYLHSPEWFGYVVLLVLAVLAAIGVDAWTEPRPLRQRVKMIGPAALFWLVLPGALGAGITHVFPALIAGAAGGLVLMYTVWHPGRALIIPGLVALELTTAGVLGFHDNSLPFRPLPTLLQAGADPQLNAASFVRTGPMVEALKADGPARFTRLPRLRKSEPLPPPDVNGVLTNQSLLFQTEEVGTFNPVQPFRYWVMVRASQHLDIKYNRSYLTDPVPVAFDLFQVGWVVTPEARPPLPATTEVAREGGIDPWILYRLAVTPPRAEAVPSWKVVPGSSRGPFPNPALDAVLSATFDASKEAIVERDPGLGRPPGTASFSTSSPRVTYMPLGDQAERITVETATPVVLLVRNAFDPNWKAEVDGHPSTVLRADYFLQAVPVPPGRHVLLLRYHDPSIGYGLLGSGAALCLAAGAILVSRRRRAPAS